MSRHWIVIIFWLIVLSILFGVYFFFPSIFHRMQQATYQKTPYVNVPRQL